MYVSGETRTSDVSLFSRFLLPARNLGRRSPRLAFAYMNASSPASSTNDSAVVRSLVVEAVEAAAELR